MIFVTVGTHEQQFNRLIQYMDKLAEIIDEEIVIQTGYSDYEPKNCKWQKMFSYEEMDEKINKARIVVTHGGPSSFVAPLQKGKIPIVVPRLKMYDEHVNDHQSYFCKQVSERMNNIIVIDEVCDIEKVIEKYEEIVNSKSVKINRNNARFCLELESAIKRVLR